MPDNDDYRLAHRAPGPWYGVQYYALSEQTDDIYEHPEYCHGGDDSSVVEGIRAARGNPAAMVTIYRSVPADNGQASIRPGDWVTTSRTYADEHGYLENYESRVISAEVPASAVWWNGDSLYEFGYWPIGG